MLMPLRIYLAKIPPISYFVVSRSGGSHINASQVLEYRSSEYERSKFNGKGQVKAMNIRYANEKDALLLAELGRKTFYDSFIEFNTEEDMVKYLSEHYSEEIQMSEIQDPNAVFLIAEQDGMPVGYAKLKGDSKGDGVAGTNPMELQRIYSIQEYIGKGVGPALMKESIREAKDRGFNCLWLGVWEKNERAIRFYEKWGLKKVGNHIFILGENIQNDFTMELSLAS
jgi:GNAT superfamily N-acetyltransferase